MRASPFVLHVTSVLRSRTPRHERVAAPLAGMAVTGSAVPDGAEVEVEVDLAPAGAAVSATGTITAPWVGGCRRCLTDVHGTLTVEFRELFEADFAEGETYPLQRDGTVDLEPLVREAVVPELPQVPLCRDTCRGLCAECGADRNEGPCGHERGPVDPRWAALDELGRDRP